MARNLCPSPAALGTGWGGSGSAGAVSGPVSGLANTDRTTGFYTIQGGATGNARVSAEPYIAGADQDGAAYSASAQGWVSTSPTRCANPVCATDASGWGVGYGSTGTRVTGLTGMVATTGYRSTKTATADIHAITSEAVTVTPGETVTAVAQVRTSTATPITPYLNFYTAGGGVVSQPTGPVVNTTANGQSFVRVTATVPAGSAVARIVPLTGVVAVGATLTVTGVRIDACNDPAMEYSGALSCSLELVFRNAVGAQLATVTGPPVTLTAGGVAARLYASGTAPVGTRRVQAQLLTRVTAAGQRASATAARVDQVADSALGYFDGASSGWIWEGAAGLSFSCDGWRADTDSSSTPTDALQIGYVGTQRQTNNEPITNGGDPIPVSVAPFGRPGRALQIVASDPPWQRLETNPNHVQFGSGEDWWFGFAFALGAGFPTWVDDYMVIDQLHGAPSTGSPPISFETRQYSLRLRGGDNRPKTDAGDNYGSAYAYNVPLLQNLRVNRWYAVVYHLITSDQLGGGSLDVWVDGVQRLAGFAPPPGSVYGTTEFPSTGGKTYRKQGLYKRPALPGGTVWHAGAALGRSYAAVDPTRSQLVATSESMAPVAA